MVVTRSQAQRMVVGGYEQVKSGADRTILDNLQKFAKPQLEEMIGRLTDYSTSIYVAASSCTKAQLVHYVVHCLSKDSFELQTQAELFQSVQQIMSVGSNKNASTSKNTPTDKTSKGALINWLMGNQSQPYRQVFATCQSKDDLLQFCKSFDQGDASVELSGASKAQMIDYLFSPEANSRRLDNFAEDAYWTLLADRDFVSKV